MKVGIDESNAMLK